MNISIGPRTQRLLKASMKLGGYRNAEDAVQAGLQYLEQQEQSVDFAPGELDRLLAAADQQIERGETIDGEAAFRARRRRRRQIRKKAQ